MALKEIAEAALMPHGSAQRADSRWGSLWNQKRAPQCPSSLSFNLTRCRQELEQKVRQFQVEVAQFQQERDAFDRERQKPRTHAGDSTLTAREADLEKQKQELNALREQFFEEQEERAKLLAKLQANLDESIRKAKSREQKIVHIEKQAIELREQEKRDRQDLVTKTAEQERARPRRWSKSNATSTRPNRPFRKRNE